MSSSLHPLRATLPLAVALSLASILGCPSKEQAPTATPEQNAPQTDTTAEQPPTDTSQAPPPEPAPEDLAEAPPAPAFTLIYPPASPSWAACNQALAERFVQPGELGEVGGTGQAPNQQEVGEAGQAPNQQERWLALPESRPFMPVPPLPEGSPCVTPTPGDSWLFPSTPPVLLVLSEQPILYAFSETQDCFVELPPFSQLPPAAEPKLVQAINAKSPLHIEWDLYPELEGTELLTLSTQGLRIDPLKALGDSPQLAQRQLLNAPLGLPTPKTKLDPQSDELWPELAPIARFRFENNDEDLRTGQLRLFPEPLAPRLQVQLDYGKELEPDGEQELSGESRQHLLELNERGFFERQSEAKLWSQSGKPEQREQSEQRVAVHHWPSPKGELYVVEETQSSLTRDRQPAYAKNAIYKEKPCNVLGRLETEQRDRRVIRRWYYSTAEHKPLLLSRTDSSGAEQSFKLDKELEFPSANDIRALSQDFEADLLATGTSKHKVRLSWNRIVLSETGPQPLFEHNFEACDRYFTDPTKVSIHIELKVRPRGLDALQLVASRRISVETYGLEADACTESGTWTWLRASKATLNQHSFRRELAIPEGCDELP